MDDGIINMLCEVYMLIKHGVRDRKLRCPECNKIIDKFYPGYFPHTGGLTGPAEDNGGSTLYALTARERYHILNF